MTSAAEIPFRRPLVIVSGLSAAHREMVRDFALALNAPVYAEPSSGIREDERLRDLLVSAGERMLARGSFDGVVRIGAVPTVRFWRDLEESLADLPVVSFSDAPFPGLSRGQVHPIDFPSVTARDRDDRFFSEDRRFAGEIGAILDREPESELAMVRALSREMPAQSRVYLGNSLPIREWDLIASREPKGFVCEANRGANGIDGQLSTFFGWCAPRANNIAVLGDLTALYDMNAPWIVPQLGDDVAFTITIINNGGGRIFSRVASLRAIDRRLMENSHTLSFEPWAEMWGLPYGDRSAVRSVLELRPEEAASARVWQAYDALWS
ncbi:MAG: hypothetical protein JJE51_10020 [Thermoanaerobaculia bacterium]|nr:hypothetical protein [Thermoanaerobaculia bacterium]